MSQYPEKSEYRYTVFGGLSSNGDPRDIGGGAMEMENLTLIVPGQLTSRKGFGLVDFENATGTADADTLSIYRYETPAHKFVLAQLSHGGVTAGMGASI